MSARAQAATDILAFQIVWIACAFGASAGLNWPGVAMAAVVILAHLSTHAFPASRAILILSSGVLGFVVESLFLNAGLLSFEAAWPSNRLAPAWICALWAAFATTLSAFQYFFGRQAISFAIAIGFLICPLSYLAGNQLGALHVTPPMWITFLSIAIAWAFALPLLMWLANKLRVTPTRSPT